MAVLLAQKEQGSSLPGGEPTPRIPAKLRASSLFDGSTARPKPEPASTPEPVVTPVELPEEAKAAIDNIVNHPSSATPRKNESEDGMSIVDRMTEDLMEEIENEVVDEADLLASIAFDSLAMGDKDLVTRCVLMARRLKMPQKLNVDEEVIVGYFKGCRDKMHADAPFHNWHHVADVTQCLYTLLTNTGLSETLSKEQLIAVFLAAPAHDLDHRGRSNVYEINENTEIARAFPGEKGPLECHHSSLAAQLVEDSGILAGLSTSSADLVRACVKNAILATDMGRHGALMNRFNAVTAEIEMEITLESTNSSLADFFLPGDKGWLLLGMLVKASDVSNPSRSIGVADKWNDLVYQEFYAEGDVDKAKGRPLNPLHDRENNIISKSSVGFIGFVVLPIFQSIQHFLETATMEADEGEDYGKLDPAGVRPFCEGLMLNKNVSKATGSLRLPAVFRLLAASRLHSSSHHGAAANLCCLLVLLRRTVSAPPPWRTMRLLLVGNASVRPGGWRQPT